MDTDAMIKLTKGSAKETVSKAFTLILPPQVRRECVEQGKAGGYPDAIRIEENLKTGRLVVARGRRSAGTEALIRDLKLLGGEADVVRLYRAGGADLIVSDDRRFLQFLEGLGIPFATPAALIVALVRQGHAAPKEGLALLDKIAGSISEDEYREARRALGGS